MLSKMLPLILNRLSFTKNHMVDIANVENLVDNANVENLVNASVEMDEHVPEIAPINYIKKEGFIKQKHKEIIIVYGDDDDTVYKFDLPDIEVEYKPRLGDRVTLFCENQNDSDEGLQVRKMEPCVCKSISGKITTIENDRSGCIDEKYYFTCDALADDEVIDEGVEVEAECIECYSRGSGSWRCIRVSALKNNTNKNGFIDNKYTMNKNGIEITDEIVVDFDTRNETKEFTMMVKNTSDIDYKIKKSFFVGNKRNSQFSLISPTRCTTSILKAGDESKYIFRATSKEYGEAVEVFRIEFDGPSGHFKIDRYIKIAVEDIEHSHAFIGSGSNVFNNRMYSQRVFDRDRTNLIPGNQFKRHPNFVKTHFESWEVPSDIKKAVLSASPRSAINATLDSIWPFLNFNLDSSNYNLKFHYLLYLEECEMFHNMRKYDKKSFFCREKEYLVLAVDNVAESRPSIVLGDHVEVLKSWTSTNEKPVVFLGWIHEVKKNSILLKFDESFHNNYKNEDYNITFYFSRTSLRKQHHALESVGDIQSILFPDEVSVFEKQVDIELNVHTGELQRPNEAVLPWYNNSLNILQKQAVTNILQGVARPMPYVIFGPPGTGKTVTLIETILQLIKLIPQSRILVATPSNSSANLITQRIVESGVLKNNDFKRLVGENNVQKDLIPENIIRFCGTVNIARDGSTKDGPKVTESGLTRNCNGEYLRRHRLLIGTCITLGTLMQCEFPDGHFSHVIIDESGQCLETKAIIPILFVDRHIGQVILAGDPNQLGPIVLSRFAANRGLNKSYLERILDRTPYQPKPEFKNSYDPRLVMKLVNNYRSLPSIMNVYSDLFYNKDLKPMVNDVNSEESKILRKLAPILPNFGNRDVTQGVVFHGVEGKSEISADSPSWFNREEAEKVYQYFRKLLTMGCAVDDIGIITPYLQQVKTIRTLLQKNDLIPPKIGTVEEFQGQERKIILLSTVRTVRHQLAFDEKHSLGFVKSPKRMNVAISRARALLVVFGNPKLLAHDENWLKFIQHCIKNKCSINCDKLSNDDDE